MLLHILNSIFEELIKWTLWDKIHFQLWGISHAVSIAEPNIISKVYFSHKFPFKSTTHTYIFFNDVPYTSIIGWKRHNKSFRKYSFWEITQWLFPYYICRIWIAFLCVYVVWILGPINLKWGGGVLQQLSLLRVKGH